jgi:hypothetical protein
MSDSSHDITPLLLLRLFESGPVGVNGCSTVEAVGGFPGVVLGSVTFPLDEVLVVGSGTTVLDDSLNDVGFSVFVRIVRDELELLSGVVAR